MSKGFSNNNFVFPSDGSCWAATSDVVVTSPRDAYTYKICKGDIVKVISRSKEGYPIVVVMVGSEEHSRQWLVAVVSPKMWKQFEEVKKLSEEEDIV
ncbi:hypothetical protein GYA37_03365 [candidate division WWE3 bacterium]|uniref:Uncharacterized protein n=1 Tax=candidate division WWE3 bacterium TaxID=2053526 RepID=A0A7X9E7Q9_UNCKA|nr:hypothetical protein [candidate division WWE3 bacterium]